MANKASFDDFPEAAASKRPFILRVEDTSKSDTKKVVVGQVVPEIGGENDSIMAESMGTYDTKAVSSFPAKVDKFSDEEGNFILKAGQIIDSFFEKTYNMEVTEMKGSEILEAREKGLTVSGFSWIDPNGEIQVNDTLKWDPQRKGYVVDKDGDYIHRASRLTSREPQHSLLQNAGAVKEKASYVPEEEFGLEEA